MKHELLWLFGGLCVAAGVVSALSGGFGVQGGDIAEVYSTLGYDGVDNLRINGNGMIGLLLVASGIGMLVTANASSWKRTGGY